MDWDDEKGKILIRETKGNKWKNWRKKNLGDEERTEKGEREGKRIEKAKRKEGVKRGRGEE